jgi:hypothetical protein
VPITIGVDGLNEFNHALKRLDKDLPKLTRLAMNKAADVVVQYGRARIPVRTGRAKSTIKAKSTRGAVRVGEGGKRAPWTPWLDFGGRTGRRKRTIRKFISEGRYLYPALYEKGDEIQAALEDGLREVAAAAGLEL